MRSARVESGLDAAFGGLRLDDAERVAQGLAEVERLEVEGGGARVFQELRDARVDARDLGLELQRELLDERALLRVGGSERGAQVVEREVDVVERVAYLVRDGGGETAHDSRLLGLLDLRFEFAHAPKLRDHLVEGRGEKADLVASVC